MLSIGICILILKKLKCEKIYVSWKWLNSQSVVSFYFLWYFFSSKSFSPNILFWKIMNLQISWMSPLMISYTLDLDSLNHMCTIFFLLKHTHTTLFLAEPLNIVAAVTSGVCWRTEVCYFSWFLSWRIPFPSFPYDHKEILYFFPQYFKFHQALKLLGVHFCVMSRDHIECFPWNNLAKQLHF